jgi:hypothetical protein
MRLLGASAGVAAGRPVGGSRLGRLLEILDAAQEPAAGRTGPRDGRR